MKIDAACPKEPSPKGRAINLETQIHLVKVRSGLPTSTVPEVKG